MIRSRHHQVVIIDPDFEDRFQERKSSHYIFTQWRLFLLVLRFIGSCPIKLRQTPKSRTDGKVNFEFKLFSFVTFYSVLWNIFRIGLCLLYYRDWARVVMGRGYRDTVEDWIVRSMNISLPFYQVWDIVCVWLTIKKGVKTCNKWVQFESKFCDTFGSHYTYSCNLQKYRRRLLLASSVPIAIVVGLFFIDYFSIVASKTDQELNHQYNSSIVEITKAKSEDTRSSWNWISIPNEFYFLPVPFFVLTAVLEEVKILLMYRTLSEAYFNLRKGIESEIKEGNLLTEDAICEWGKILRLIRKQGILTGQFQAPHQLVVLIHIIITSTESLFIFIKSTTVNQTIKYYFWMTVGISSLYVFRIMAKIILAEQITHEEQRVADKIIQINPSKLDVLGKLEAKKITDLILQNPMKISLAGYVTIDKRMVPKILSYVVAYFVVLFQFQLGVDFKKSDECIACSNSL